ncbi:MAG TPA: sigma-E factor regulatory protein RseB domain-containing protein [Fimbriimonadaceae bacterium]|nr:sigma-E factor regulatory protein RseB domain-containing protein [Fimbriimonadaceae bacterium]
MRILLLTSLMAAAAITCAQGRAVPVGGGQNESPKQLRLTDETKKAQELLRMAMGRVPIYNVQAIITQRLDYSSPLFQQIKVQISKEGKLHQIILAPLDYQGIELVDDGQKMWTYTPDDKRVIVQPSARQDEDVKFRMKLVVRNYTIRLERREKVAGRDAAIVTATPKDDDLETRCYAIDENTGFLLRLETCKEGSAPVLHFETKMVQFPDKFAKGTFEINSAFVTTEHYDRKCVGPESANDLVDELGFHPVVPNKLPFGFAVQELQAATDSRPTALAVRITDGLAKATIIEWEGGRSSKAPAPQGTIVANSGRLTLLISGDMPDDVKDRILRAFVQGHHQRDAWKLPDVTLSWVQELRSNAEAFSINREPGRVAPTAFSLPVANQD